MQKLRASNEVNDPVFSMVRLALPFLGRRSLRSDKVSLRGSGWWKKSRKYACRLWIAAAAFLCLGRAQATVTVSVPTGLQADFIAGTTSQWVGTVTPGLFAGDSKITITAKKPTVPTVAVPCTPDENIKAVIANSSWTFVFGFYSGQQYERSVDLGTIGNEFVTCKSTDTCQDGLARASDVIYQQNYSSPTVINVP